MKGSEAKGRAYASQMPVQRGKRRFIKCNYQKGTEEGQKITSKMQPQGAGIQAAGHLICNLTPPI
jgi:hypothetical protein